MRLILASASPRRKELIKKIDGLQVEIVPSGAEEKTNCTDPISYATALASLKAQEVYNRTGGVVLGADTVVVLDGEILGKPRTAAEADEMFHRLCGRTHEVVTGLCIIGEGHKVTDAEVSYVTFGEYDANIIEAYIGSGAPFDKAGGYGIQDEALSPIVKNVKGDLDNIIGLPVQKVEKLLKQFRR
ncbi:MAG: septum formation protein Maf [Clostridiales bacterium]|nr:septum formation protein Maf [Clostridiales bacterium]